MLVLFANFPIKCLYKPTSGGIGACCPGSPMSPRRPGIPGTPSVPGFPGGPGGPLWQVQHLLFWVGWLSATELSILLTDSPMTGASRVRRGDSGFSNRECSSRSSFRVARVFN